MYNKKLIIAAEIIIFIVVVIYFFNKGKYSANLNLQKVTKARARLIETRSELETCQVELASFVDQIKKTRGEALTIDSSKNAVKKATDDSMVEIMYVYDELLKSISPDIRTQIDDSLSSIYPNPSFIFTTENIYEVFNNYTNYMINVVKVLNNIINDLQEYISQVEEQFGGFNALLNSSSKIIEGVGKMLSQNLSRVDSKRGAGFFVICNNK